MASRNWDDIFKTLGMLEHLVAIESPISILAEALMASRTSVDKLTTSRMASIQESADKFLAAQELISRSSDELMASHSAAAQESVRKFSSGHDLVSDLARQIMENQAALAADFANSLLASKSLVASLAEQIASSQAMAIQEAAEQAMADAAFWRMSAADTARLIDVLTTKSVARAGIDSSRALRRALEPSGKGTRRPSPRKRPPEFLEFSISRIVTAVAKAGGAIDPGAQALIIILLIVSLKVGWEQAVLLFISLFGQGIRAGVNRAAGTDGDS